MVDSKIKAVHDDDLMNLLISLNIYDDVLNNNCTCYFCGAQINIDNLASIFPHDNEIMFCCDFKKCVFNLISLRNKEDSTHAYA